MKYIFFKLIDPYCERACRYFCGGFNIKDGDKNKDENENMKDDKTKLMVLHLLLHILKLCHFIFMYRLSYLSRVFFVIIIDPLKLFLNTSVN